MVEAYLRMRDFRLPSNWRFESRQQDPAPMRGASKTVEVVGERRSMGSEPRWSRPGSTVPRKEKDAEPHASYRGECTPRQELEREIPSEILMPSPGLQLY